jgi:hypothetical protein
MARIQHPREQAPEYMVDERAGYVGERDIRGFPTRGAAERHVERHYSSDEQDTLYVAVQLDLCDGTSTYDQI